MNERASKIITATFNNDPIRVMREMQMRMEGGGRISDAQMNKSVEGKVLLFRSCVNDSVTRLGDF